MALGLALLGLIGVAAVGLILVAGALLGHQGQAAPAADDVPVHEGHAQLGSSSDSYAVWERNDDGDPVRWDPCSPIEVVLGEGGPAGWRDDLDGAVVILREATGLDIEVVGTVDEPPTADRSPYQLERYGDRWAPVLVAWARPGDGGLPMRDVDRGLGIPIAVGIDGDRTYVTGQVVLNADRDDLRLGWDDRRYSWGATILHELAHVLGLAHVDDPDELMATFPGEGPIEFGPGDRAGLRRIGSGSGCREVPQPGPISVGGLPDSGS